MKKCIIVFNTHKNESHEIGKQIASWLLDRNVICDFFSFDGFCTQNPFDGYDFAVTLGGDGTVLFAARGCAKNGIPVFSVNLGEFGFIASVQKNEWKSELKNFLDGKAYIAERNLISAYCKKHDSEKEEYYGSGLNDIVVCAKTAARNVMFEVSFNEVALGRMKADGVILSTATGSTAYSSSAGGPIIDPDLDAFVLTLLDSFSLSGRPLVLNPRGELKIKILDGRENNVLLIVDGQKPFELTANDVIKIKISQDKVRLVGCSNQKFYEALRSKLNWSGGPHA